MKGGILVENPKKTAQIYKGVTLIENLQKANRVKGDYCMRRVRGIQNPNVFKRPELLK